MAGVVVAPGVAPVRPGRAALSCLPWGLLGPRACWLWVPQVLAAVTAVVVAAMVAVVAVAAMVLGRSLELSARAFPPIPSLSHGLRPQGPLAILLHCVSRLPGGATLLTRRRMMAVPPVVVVVVAAAAAAVVSLSFCRQHHTLCLIIKRLPLLPLLALPLGIEPATSVCVLAGGLVLSRGSE